MKGMLMKYCKNCGTENNESNQFCFNCQSTDFSPVKEAQAQGTGFAPPPPPPMPVPYVQQPMPYIQQPMIPRKKPLKIFDLLAILGFVAALVGMFSTSIILHPLAAIVSIIGFIGDTRFKGLAIAGFVISIVGGIVYTVLSLYQNNMIPGWITNGAFH